MLGKINLSPNIVLASRCHSLEVLVRFTNCLMVKYLLLFLIVS